MLCYVAVLASFCLFLVACHANNEFGFMEPRCTNCDFSKVKDGDLAACLVS